MLSVAALIAGGCGGGHKQTAGRLEWMGKPNVYRAHNLPNDRVVIARVHFPASLANLRFVMKQKIFRTAGLVALRLSSIEILPVTP